MGDPDAPVVIVEFTDIKCPWCMKTHEVLKQGRKIYGDKYCVYLIHYPLDQSCNPELANSLHPGACRGTYGARCAQIQGKFWEYVDLLFEQEQSYYLLQKEWMP